MGLIREPKNIDFYVLDKPWTNAERSEFSAFIKQRKEQLRKTAKIINANQHEKATKTQSKNLHQKFLQ